MSFSFMSVDQDCLGKSQSDCARWTQCVCLSRSGSFMDAVDRTLTGIIQTDLSVRLLTFTPANARLTYIV